MLKYVAKGFPGAHGSRHLYNMMGGKVYEVDFMSAVSTVHMSLPADALLLDLPAANTDKPRRVRMVVPVECQDKIRLALDCLPWNSLSWSIHRGMRDILLAFGKPVMDEFRKRWPGSESCGLHWHSVWVVRKHRWYRFPHGCRQRGTATPAQTIAGWARRHWCSREVTHAESWVAGVLTPPAAMARIMAPVSVRSN